MNKILKLVAKGFWSTIFVSDLLSQNVKNN